MRRAEIAGGYHRDLGSEKGDLTSISRLLRFGRSVEGTIPTRQTEAIGKFCVETSAPGTGTERVAAWPYRRHGHLHDLDFLGGWHRSPWWCFTHRTLLRLLPGL